MKKLGILMAGLLLLTACSDEKAAPAESQEPAEEKAAVEEQQEMSESGFITQVTSEEILVNNIYFKVTEDVGITSDNGTENSEALIRDLRAGMKVSVDYTGPLEQTFPMEAEAETITILNDEESAAQAEALQSFINEEKVSSLLIMGQPIVRDNEIGFLFNDMQAGSISEVRIDLDTHEYTVDGE